ncbi:histidine phosphatase family protein [Cucumibacter marinus]|uniref:histidine phosphatase family protein n=1 Tax=Cucumibacter marinus TaxID=1121252 RepID=UPI000401FB79|nr:histidine phosphatase family protein [Cucumibacter marinus]
MRVLLIRHGQSEWNASKRLQGQADISLSETGRRQASALREVLAEIRPDRAIGSDLKRVRETVERAWSGEVEFTPGLREIDVGDWTGRAVPELIDAEPLYYAGWRAGTHTPPGGESWADFKQRVSAVIDRNGRLASHDNLLVACHGGVIRAVLDHYLGLEPRHIIPVAPASLTAIRVPGDGGPARLELFNYRPTGLDFEAPD